jgi:NAD-dependent dihydropyrimidine dehydrogenase PreA subunit
MIELVVEDRCTDCGACVEACPRDVFEPGPAGRPVIARGGDCQTCYLCELYCPADAIYVGPNCEQAEPTSAEAVAPLLGCFRRDSGWGEWSATVPNEHWRMGEIFARARAMAAERG